MVSIEDLKKIIVLQDLPDSMLEGMRSLTQLRLFGEGAVIFEEGQAAEVFYMLLKGKLILEVEASELVTVSLGAIKPGYSFGWSAVMGEGMNYTSTTLCAEPCQVYSIRAEKIRNLLKSDYEMAYLFNQRLIWIVKNRLDHRTSQFVTVLRNHPDIESLI